MSYEDPEKSPKPPMPVSVPARAPAPAAERAPAPGKRPLAARQPAAAPGVAVQRKAELLSASAALPVDEPGRRERNAHTARWLDTAVRPDLYPPPVQRFRGTATGDGAAAPLPDSGSGRALPGDVQAKMEHAMGADFSAVRVHEGPRATALGALAYTQGTDIHFAPGQYDPASTSGQELLGHELAHVVQQAEGRVQATTQAKGPGASGPSRGLSLDLSLNDDPALEREADELGARAARAAQPPSAGDPGRATGPSQSLALAPVQMARDSRVVQRTPGDRHHATGPAGEGPNTADAGAATEVPAVATSYAAIVAGTLEDFHLHAHAQADWSLGIADEGQRNQLREVLTFLREAGHHVTALGDFTVQDFITDGLAHLDAMDAYSRAYTESTDTVPVNQATTLVDARDLGADIRILEGALQGSVLKWIFTADELDRLRTENGNQVQLFADYVSQCAPLLHANDGWEIDSFLVLAQTANPASFRDIADVRNYHRFDDAALQQLRSNQAGNAGNQPMTLVLHSAFDHNGAFHHDPELTRVITEPSSHTVMVEGADSLDQISGRLPALVAAHGKDEPDPANPGQTVKRIDQLMIAGHGSARSIELAGTLETDAGGQIATDSDGEPRQDTQGLDLDADPADPVAVARARDSQQFLEELMGYMSADPATPHGRIVFNACLTASNEIAPGSVDPNASVADQQQQMQAALASNPSLVTTMRAIAAAQGKGHLDVRGGNGSFSTVGLLDGAGNLDIVADGADLDGDGHADRTLDPELTNPDKFVYIERGTDPDGCMLAVAECWAQDAARAIASVQTRRGAPIDGSWDEAVIQCFYELVDTQYAASGAAIARLASGIEGFVELHSASNARVWRIWNFENDWQLVHDRLHTHGHWTGRDHVPLVFFHGWILHDQAQIPDFLQSVARMSCREAKPYVDLDELGSMWNNLVPASAGGSPNDGQLRLALLDLAKNRESAQARTRAYLSSLVSGGAFTSDIATPLDGLLSEEEALELLGLHPRQQSPAPQPANNGGAAPPPDASVDMDQDGSNESLVASLSARGKVTASRLYVRAQPSVQGMPLGRLLARDEEVYIMGETGNWYLVDLDGQRGYAYKRHIELQ